MKSHTILTCTVKIQRMTLFNPIIHKQTCPFVSYVQLPPPISSPSPAPPKWALCIPHLGNSKIVSWNLNNTKEIQHRDSFYPVHQPQITAPKHARQEWGLEGQTLTRRLVLWRLAVSPQYSGGRITGRMILLTFHLVADAKSGYCDCSPRLWN